MISSGKISLRGSKKKLYLQDTRSTGYPAVVARSALHTSFWHEHEGPSYRWAYLCHRLHWLHRPPCHHCPLPPLPSCPSLLPKSLPPPPVHPPTPDGCIANSKPPVVAGGFGFWYWFWFWEVFCVCRLVVVGDDGWWFVASEKKSNINNRQRERRNRGRIDYERALPSKIGTKSNVQANWLFREIMHTLLQGKINWEQLEKQMTVLFYAVLIRVNTTKQYKIYAKKRFLATWFCL